MILGNTLLGDVRIKTVSRSAVGLGRHLSMMTADLADHSYRDERRLGDQKMQDGEENAVDHHWCSTRHKFDCYSCPCIVDEWVASAMSSGCLTCRAMVGRSSCTNSYRNVALIKDFKLARVEHNRDAVQF